LVRVYRGAQQSDVVRAFQRDAAELAKSGYQPMSQSWAAGQWGCGGFLIALLLCFVLIGFLVFVYMLVVRPAGTLTVTYGSQAAAAPATTYVAQPETAPTSSELMDRLRQLQAAHQAGLISDDEFAAKRGEMLRGL
jgi:hypothetical protein